MGKHSPKIVYDVVAFPEERWGIGPSLSRWFEECSCDGFKTKKSGYMLQEVSWYQDNPNRDEAITATWFACDSCLSEFREWFAKAKRLYETTGSTAS